MLTSFLPDLHAWLRRQIRDHAYPGYVYGYPHKKAYRPLHPLHLEDVWRDEDRRNLFCYVHIPFCNQRCSFCNLFTYVPGSDSPGLAYVEALGREMRLFAEAMTPFSISKLYLGGGTPTYLTAGELRCLVGYLRTTLGIDPARTEGCIECSPETLDAEKIQTLRELGFQRISLGVQSFRAEELRQVNRRFDPRLHDEVIGLIAHAGFPEFNMDLIYGLPGQTEATWRESIQRVIDTAATSVFLYPLYIRPLTGLGIRQVSLETPSTHAMGAMYDLASDYLGRAGFRQLTMRQFRRDAPTSLAEYRCESDALLGLGAGARSYTNRLHYSTPWKMVGHNIRAVVAEYVSRMSAGDKRVSHGFFLDEDERQRRFMIQTLLFDGLDVTEFEESFGHNPRERFAEALMALAAERLIREEGVSIHLTALGVRHADIVGQLFFSDKVSALISEFEYDR